MRWRCGFSSGDAVQQLQHTVPDCLLGVKNQGLTGYPGKSCAKPATTKDPTCQLMHGASCCCNQIVLHIVEQLRTSTAASSAAGTHSTFTRHLKLATAASSNVPTSNHQTDNITPVQPQGLAPRALSVLNSLRAVLPYQVSRCTAKLTPKGSLTDINSYLSMAMLGTCMSCTTHGAKAAKTDVAVP
jgi:hypothetical protein